MDERKKPGPKPITGKTLSAAERKQRQRMKQAFINEAAKDSGYISVSVLLNEKQLIACGELDHVVSGGKADRPLQERINKWIFYALKNHIESAALEYDLKLPKEDDWPQHCEVLWGVEHNARLKFNQWEKEISANEDISN